MQKISDILFSIAQREDSGVATRYDLKESPQNVELSPASDIFEQLDADLYAGWMVGVEADCQRAKQFLPLLADSETRKKVTVPASITAHIELCPQCRADFQTIRSWNLDYKKRVRLAEFLSKQTFQQSDECSVIYQNRELITDLVAQMRFEQLSPEVLKHICLCLTCRNLLYEARSVMRAKIPDLPKTINFPCETVKAADLFDYVFPYGIDPANDEDEYEKFRESLTDHLRQCPRCLEKIRQLHNSIYSIAERDRFEVPAGYDFARQPASQLWPMAEARKIAGSIEDIDEEEFDAQLVNLFKDGSTNELYSQWGIKVEVTSEPEYVPEHAISAKVIALPRKFRQKVSAVNIRSFRIPAAAAVILIAVGLFLFLGTPAARAVELSQIYEAIVKVKNVCISSFVPDKTEPVQKIWVSRTLNIKLFKTGEQFVLRDIPNKIIKGKHLSSDSITITQPSTDTLAKFEKDLEGCFGLLPFPSITDVPEDAQWNQVTDENVEAIVPGTKVYDLTWRKVISPTITEYHKWRVFINIQTNLPKREESYKKTAIEDDYILESIRTVTYPTDGEIKAVIGDLDF